MYDVFVAELSCPHCGSVLPTTADTGMQTHLRSDADGAMLGVGFALDDSDLTTESLLGAGYALIAAPAPGEALRLLEVWSCPVCSTEQWARVTIADGTIRQIEAVALTRATLESASFISEINAALFAQRFATPGTASAVDVLRKHLA